METNVTRPIGSPLKKEMRTEENALVLKGYLFNIHGHGDFHVEYETKVGKNHAEANFSMTVNTQYFYSECVSKYGGSLNIRIETKRDSLGITTGKVNVKLDEGSKEEVSHVNNNVSDYFERHFDALKKADGKKEQEAAARELFARTISGITNEIASKFMMLRFEEREAKGNVMGMAKIEMRRIEMEKTNFVVNRARIFLFER
jgi:hypothetical protein